MEGAKMNFGVFSIPFNLDYVSGKRTAQDVIEWDLRIAQWADESGLSEMHFAEHYTLGREVSPAPDLMIAAAAQVTSRIRLGAAAHLLPYHNPIALAHRLMWLDHMTGGRYIAGVAPGAYPTDAQLFGTGENNAEMMSEALDIILEVWTHTGPFRIEGKYWTVDMPEYTERWHGPHLKPLQRPHPPLQMTGMQPKSPTLAEAGRRGMRPLSQQLNSETLRQHWDTYSRGAIDAGHSPERSNWAICRDFFVANTDEEAREHVVNGELGRVWREHLLPLFKGFGLARFFGGDELSEDDLSVEWLAENFWIIGSPKTVLEKLELLQAETGGFGTLLTFGYDYSREPDPWLRSLQMMGDEVAPQADGIMQRAADGNRRPVT
jgi:alkanesulfonate monooxygenase SsuD/methylene tetrahydromethanopterin reductase-like flavin-dependent oxidoreductase (luciferase family)